ncbi:Zinc-type alcohol dehydrogenase-like protein C1773.06c [Mesorhizobium metallidurans STM 2683]|uniref:Zinc-type alcohol dehydrogenase-like protein C1773.06c n=1 Tax=Mesorhizobium metallidurans STM 2683 TaxID=1297569 RepID=M5F8F4_9HYPH|nr:NAD(P)-dependent alcohol dehydrogenase [Mesorhizobium metallidurans]CCV08186.1 Zinc-type alcohol dehydrogenase-like protein C1773.06c [Mesorhizobium metallidurans STM 2683]
MKAIELTAPRLDAFRAATVPTPDPQRGEVLIRLRAASLNFVDVAVASGKYPGSSFPLIPVVDGAGEIVGIGEGVSRLALNDRVIAHAKPRWIGGRPRPCEMTEMRGVTLPGSLAEYVALPANAVVPMPANLSFETAATLPIAATTAWNAMRSADVGPGSVVVLLGTGGVSIFALQLAKASGGTVIITSSSDEKLARAKALGADHLINYRTTPDWDAKVLELTNGLGADLIVETGGSATFARSLNAAAPGGTVFVIGFVTGTEATADLLPIIIKALKVLGNNTGSVSDLRDAARAIAAARIEPVIDKVFTQDQAAEAYAHMAAGGRHFGKLAFALEW